MNMAGQTTNHRYMEQYRLEQELRRNSYKQQVRKNSRVKMAAPMASGEEDGTYYYEETHEDNVESNVFDAGRCNVENVVVYLDRAEVCRCIKSRVRKGENQITIKKLSPSIDKDTLRVEGKGPATILEVIYNITPMCEEEEENEQRFREQREHLHELQRNKEAMENRKRRIQKQREVLDGFADNLLKSQNQGVEDKSKNDVSDDKKEMVSSPSKSATPKSPQRVVEVEKRSSSRTVSRTLNPLDANLMEGMVGFFDLYDRQATRLDESQHELNIEMEKIEEQIKEADRIVKEMETYKDEHMAREVIILMEATEDGEVELQLSYIVQKAKWTPKYDIRVFSGDSRMKIIYYGMIQQATCEDWDEAKITLSTAAPSVGGTCPNLGTQRLFFKPKVDSQYSSLRRTKPGRKNKKVSRAWSFHATKDEKSFLKQYGLMSDEESSAKEDEKKEDKVEKEEEKKEQNNVSFDLKKKEEGDDSAELCLLQVKELIASTQYDVVRRHTIQSDNTPHRVTIAIIDLNPVFEYECVPKCSPYAYLKAKVKNTSPYALLAGQTSIFLDNNFCAKSEIKAVAPLEDFKCNLGADHAIKITYKPMQKSRESGSVVSKCTQWTHKQSIEVRNTHAESVKILIMDQLPLSTEEKIKVNLIEPVIKHPEKYDRSKPIRLNKHNNVEWSVDIGAGETKELTLKYQVEHPTTEEVEASVLHVNKIVESTA